MSTYNKETKHPITGKWEDATWIDDYFGNHNYGVRFATDYDRVFDPRAIELETREAPIISEEYSKGYEQGMQDALTEQKKLEEMKGLSEPKQSGRWKPEQDYDGIKNLGDALDGWIRVDMEEKIDIEEFVKALQELIKECIPSKSRINSDWTDGYNSSIKQIKNNLKEKGLL